jgi:hypothetical protein
MPNLNFLINVLKEYGPSALVYAIIAFVVIYLFICVIDEDRGSSLRSWIYKVLHSLSGKRIYEKKYISNDINARINLARRKLYFGKEILPKSISVEWVEGKPVESFNIKEGEFIVRLDPSEKQDKNIVHLTQAVVERTTLVGVRHLMEKPLSKSIDYILIKNLLALIDQSVLSVFLSDEFIPNIKENTKLSEWSDKIEEIDLKGLFTRVLLVELESFSKKIAGLFPKPYMAGEIEQLVDYLHAIASREVGQHVPLEFVRAHMGIGFIMVGVTARLLKEGIDPYIKRFCTNLNTDIDTCYLMIFERELSDNSDSDTHNEIINKTKELKDELKNYPTEKEYELSYNYIDNLGKKRKGIIIKYVKSNYV